MLTISLQQHKEISDARRKAILSDINNAVFVASGSVKNLIPV